MEIRGNLVGRREGDQVPDPLRADPAISMKFHGNLVGWNWVGGYSGAGDVVRILK